MKFLYLQFLFLIFSFCTTILSAQEIETALPYNKQLLHSRTLHSSLPKDEESSVELPFIDDFSQDHFIDNQEGNQVLWLDRNVFRNNTFAMNPLTVGVVTFDGLNSIGLPYDANNQDGVQPADTLTSAPINLSDVSNVGISFYFQRQGYGNSPETNENLILEFFSPSNDTWQNVWEAEGGSGVADFEFVYLPIDNELNLVDSFQFRFRNLGNVTGSLDHWHIDYVWIDINPINESPIVNDVAFTGVPYTLLKNYSSVPWKHFRIDPSSYMSSSVDVNLFNLNNVQRTLVENNFSISYKSNPPINFTNLSHPPIESYSGLVYTHSVNQAPNNFIFDTSVNDTCAVFDVKFSHGVSDFALTESNDTIKFKQNFIDYYAYDDGTAERGYGVDAAGSEFAMKYNLTVSDTIYGVSIYFLPVQFNVDGDLFYLYLWEDSGSGPGNEITSSPQYIEYSPNFQNEFITYYFDEPKLLPVGDYYIGIGQTSSNTVSVGNDKNTNANATKLYFNAEGTWDTSTVLGSLCMRPLFVSLKNSSVGGISENKLNHLDVYPNPAKDFINVSYPNFFKYILSDFTGKEIASGSKSIFATIDLADISNGMYFLKIIDSKSNTYSTEKIVVQNK
jgi:hypothetical protein